MRKLGIREQNKKTSNVRQKIYSRTTSAKKVQTDTHLLRTGTI
ncbi:34704_t:CDS:1, partial [Gigaspora margarita]